MRYILMILFLIIGFCSKAQEIDEIEVQYQQADEPPTVSGHPKFIVQFKRNSSGDFIANSFLENQNKRRLSESIFISKERIDSVRDWQELNKTIFELKEFSVSPEQFKGKTFSARFDLTWPPQDSMVIDIDSFNVCKNYWIWRTISTEGVFYRDTEGKI